MSLEEKIDEILEDFDTWCACDDMSCGKAINYANAKRQLLALYEEKL